VGRTVGEEVVDWGKVGRTVGEEVVDSVWTEVVVVVDSRLEGALEGTEVGDFVGVLMGLVDGFVEGAELGDCEGESVESGANVGGNGCSVVVVGVSNTSLVTGASVVVLR